MNQINSPFINMGKGITAAGIYFLFAFSAAGMPDESIEKTQEPTLTSSSPLNISRLEAIQAETVLYEAQLANAKLRSELQKSGFETEKPFNPISPTEKTIQEAPITRQPLPQIIEISGDGKSLIALLTTSSGGQLGVRQGQQIPGTGYTVSRITMNEVLVNRQGASTVSLSFVE